MARFRTKADKIAGRRRPRKTIARRGRRTSDTRVARPSTSSGFGGLVAKGIRTLVSWLPGQSFIKPISDLFFNAFGIAQKVSFLSESNYTAEFYITGLTSRQTLNPTDILVETTTHGVRTIGEDGKPLVLMNYSEARIRTLKITATPTNKVADRQGMWTMAFVPFRNAMDQKAYSGDAVATFDTVRLMPGSVTKAASQSLTLSYSPKVTDGTAFTFTDLARSADSVETGVMFISFEQANRSSYTQFDPSEFACSVSVSGQVELRRPPQTTSYTTATPVTPQGYEYKEKCYGIAFGDGVVDKDHPHLRQYSCVEAQSITRSGKFMKMSFKAAKPTADFEMI